MSQGPKGKPVIGIVGGIGSGKSTVAAEFVKLGCVLADADAMGHELLGEPDVQEELARRWGRGILGDDGGVDRVKLGEIVFKDADGLRDLNAVVHPRIRRRLAERIAAAQQQGSTLGVVIDAALLFEAGWDDLCTHTVFVEAPRALRAARVGQRGWDESELAKREKMQFSLDKKVAMCDYTIRNCTSLPHLSDQIRELFARITNADSRKASS